MNSENTTEIEALNRAVEKSSSLNGLWIAALIVLLGIGLFSLVVSSSGQGEAPLINKQSKLHIASGETDNIQTVMVLPDSAWNGITGSSFPISTKAHWFTSVIPVNAQEDARLLEISYANLDYVDVWFVDENNDKPTILEHTTSGDNFPFAERAVAHDQLVFPVPDSSRALSLYIRVKTQGGIKVPIKLWQENEYIKFITSYRVFNGLFYGFMVAMALINLFLYVTSRNVSTLLYTGYVICLSLTLASSQGFGYRFLWPESIMFQQHSVLFFASSMVFFSSSFTAKLLDIKNNFKRLYSVFSAVRMVIVIYIVLIFILPFSVMASVLSLVILMVMFLIFASTVYIALTGNKVARYLAAAWCSLLISGLIGLADNLSWISVNLDPSYLMMVGAVIETLFMALGLAMRFNEQRLDTKHAHLKARENKQKAMAATEELLRLQIETKEQLEYAVDERTYELEIAMRELSEANHELERKSSIDALTGLANRRQYDKRVLAEARRSRREKTPLAIAMIDIDHFKAINDNYGHQCGDDALKHFANILKESIKRPSDTICRYGGEEFVAILPNTDLAGATALMENVRLATESSELICDGKSIKFTISIGVSTRVIVNESESDLLHAFADKLLYQAKDSGRNQVLSAAF